jgi:uncharacterized protein (TIGR02646 family)
LKERQIKDEISVSKIKNIIKKKEFHQRYKQKDVKEFLSRIYNQKCAFCEQEIAECINNELGDCSSTVEHYRPKSIYYWVAFSWDNLLWCCHRCNQNKKNTFDVTKKLGTFKKVTFLRKNRTHNMSKIYSRIENPFMINPELESVLNKLSFVDGIISSTDSRVQYTISTCRLDRDDLNEKRLEILEAFIANAKKRNRLNKSYKDVLDNLKEEFINEKSEFRALKFWILKNHKSLIEGD